MDPIDISKLNLEWSSETGEIRSPHYGLVARAFNKTINTRSTLSVGQSKIVAHLITVAPDMLYALVHLAEGDSPAARVARRVVETKGFGHLLSDTPAKPKKAPKMPGNAVGPVTSEMIPDPDLKPKAEKPAPKKKGATWKKQSSDDLPEPDEISTA